MKAAQGPARSATYPEIVRLPLPASTPANVRRLSLANLLANAGLIVTGGAVRLTGSGLGCAEWPTCNDGNIIPTSADPIHTYIEFLNRTLTFVLIVIALSTWLVIRRLAVPRKDMSRLAFMIGMGIPAQAVIGGITVLTGLNPYSVMAHLMLTMVLIYWCAVLYHRARRLDRVVPEYASRGTHWLARLLMIATYLTMGLGTFVTGSGPHSGDPEAGRTGFDPALLSQLHADAVFLLVGVSITLLVLSMVLHAPGLRRAAGLLVALEAAQGVVGYTQYFTGLPEILVGVHLALSGAVMAAASFTAEELRYVRFARSKKDAEPAERQVTAGSAE